MYKMQRTQLPPIQPDALSKKANTSHKRSYSRDYRMLHLPRIAHFELSMQEDTQSNITSSRLTGHRRSESCRNFKDARFETRVQGLDFTSLVDSEDDENTETQEPADVSSIFTRFTKQRSRSTSKKSKSTYAPSHTRETEIENNITKDDSAGNVSREAFTPHLRRQSPPRPVPAKFFSQKACDLMGIRPLNRSETCARALGLRY